MFPANAHCIRLADPADAPMLRRLAYLDEQEPLAGRVLVGELDGLPAAALSIEERRIVADPFQASGQLRVPLRLRAAAIEAHERTPSVGERMLAALRGERPVAVR